MGLPESYRGVKQSHLQLDPGAPRELEAHYGAGKSRMYGATLFAIP